MGLLVDGVWQEDVSRTTNGRFVRPNTAYHNFVTPDGSPGPNGKGGFAAEAGRYHLYISLACPWAHRTLIFRSLKQLDNVISVSLAEPLYGKTGWEFGGGQRRHARQRQRQEDARRSLSPRRSALYRPRVGAGALGQEAAHHRQQ